MHFLIVFLNIIHVLILSLLSPYCGTYIPNESKETTLLDIPGLSSLYKSENEELTYKEMLDVCEDVVFELTNEQITEIEKHTRTQQGCDLWFKYRAGRITASKMKAACHTDPASSSISLIKQICYLKQCSFPLLQPGGDVIMKTLHVKFMLIKCSSNIPNLIAFVVA